MSNLPKYYFGDIPTDLMHEIVSEMQSIEPLLEEIDQWLASPPEGGIEEWYDRVAQFKASR